MLSKTFNRLSQNTLLGSRSAISRSFGSESVTYDFKDLIIDPEQKGHQIYHTYKLDEKNYQTKLQLTRPS